MVGGKGIEPFLSRCKRESLPLQQPPIKMLDVGIEPTLGLHLRRTDYKSVGASSYTNPAKIFKDVGREGLEPSRAVRLSVLPLQLCRLPKNCPPTTRTLKLSRQIQSLLSLPIPPEGKSYH